MLSNDDKAKIQDLATSLIALIEEPIRLHDDAQAELIKTHGGPNYPLEARVESQGMQDAYNAAAENLFLGTMQAFELLASALGASGMQASYAINKVWLEVTGIKGPVKVVKAENLLYPQYDGAVREWLRSEAVASYLQDAAKGLLDSHSEDAQSISPRVLERVTALATGAIPEIEL